MSKLIICSVCGGMNIQTERRPDGDRHCLDCGSRWKIGSERLSKKQTLFDRITASPEVLAENVVESAHDPVKNRRYYTSIFIEGWHSSRKKAIAATVEKLKEVEK